MEGEKYSNEDSVNWSGWRSLFTIGELEWSLREVNWFSFITCLGNASNFSNIKLSL